MLTDTKVRIFTSAMPGAPAASTSPGGIIAILDACLVNGFGSSTLGANAMTRVGSTVTVAQGAHGYKDHSVLLVAGATDPSYNGPRRILVDSPDSYSFQLTDGSTPATPAAGTITVSIAPAGWSKPFAGTNLAAYRPADGPRHYLQVDDTSWSTIKARVRAYRAMTDVNTGTGMYPNATQTSAFNWMRPSPSGTRGWTIVADDKAAHIIFDTANGQAGTCVYYFGWFKDLYSFDTDANSLITAGTYNTVYSSGSSDATSPEACRKMWATEYVTGSNGNAANVEQCHGYLAKSYDGVQESIGFFMLGYFMPTGNGPIIGQFNNQSADNFAAVRYMGNTGGAGAAQSLKGYTMQAPFVAEPSYQSNQNQIRGVLPFLQSLTLYPATANDRKVIRYVDRFGAAYSTVMGYDGWSGSSYPRGFVVPLANWENVL